MMIIVPTLFCEVVALNKLFLECLENIAVQRKQFINIVHKISPLCLPCSPQKDMLN